MPERIGNLTSTERAQTTDRFGVEVDRDPDTRPKRTMKRTLFPRASEPRVTGQVIKRLQVFNSTTDIANFTSGVVAIADNAALLIKTTLTSKQSSLSLVIPEVSFYVDAIDRAHEYPGGTFFDNSAAKQLVENYQVVCCVSQQQSKDSTVVLISSLANKTGASQDMGVRIGVRYIVNNNDELTVANAIATA